MARASENGCDLPAVGMRAVSSPIHCITHHRMNPVIMNASNSPPGPADARAAPVPMNRPVPIPEPNPMNVTCRALSLRWVLPTPPTPTTAGALAKAFSASLPFSISFKSMNEDFRESAGVDRADMLDGEITRKERGICSAPAKIIFPPAIEWRNGLDCGGVGIPALERHSGCNVPRQQVHTFCACIPVPPVRVSPRVARAQSKNRLRRCFTATARELIVHITDPCLYLLQAKSRVSSCHSFHTVLLRLAVNRVGV